jgi:hypothetical protein
MDWHSDETGSGSGEERLAALAARFDSEDDAMNAAASINAALEEAALEADRLFAGRGGIADSAEVDRIYSRFGLRNTSGWRQERPLAVAGREVRWHLPAGAPADEAEQLLLSHGARAVRAIDRFDEGWKVAPHPLAIPFVDEESGEVFYDLVKVEDTPRRGRSMARKRTLH